MDRQDSPPRVVRFGVFELDRRSGELRRRGVRVRVQEQPLRVLDALLNEPGEPVTREALRQRLWPDDTFVDFDNGLNRAINRLRAALGDEADNPRFIETLERRGYRFIAPVGQVDASSAATAPSVPETTPSATEATPRMGPGRRRTIRVAGALASAALLALSISLMPVLRRKADAPAHPPIRSLAVLPLANLTGDPAQEYFSDGMTDALITNLASLPALRVISRQSVMRYKGSAKPLPEIARELGVEGVVEGSVVRSGGRVRITAQLVHASSDRHLWAHSYERRLEDVLTLQGELARAIAEEVRVTVGPEEGRRLGVQRAVKLDAYDAYLLGRHLWSQRWRAPQSLDRAVAHFRTAIAADPDFALAHAGLALALGPRQVYGYVQPGTGLAEQRASALKALELDPGLADARAALGAVRTIEWDWEGADAEFRRAIELNPNSNVSHHWYWWHLRARGRLAEAAVHIRRALELDPLDIGTNLSVAKALFDSGQDDAALAQWNRALELEPDLLAAHLKVALFHFERGAREAGSRHFERARVLGSESPLPLASLAVVHAASGNRREARRLLETLEAESARQHVSPVLPAMIHAALSEDDRAFALLDKACGARDPALISIQVGEIGPLLNLTRARLAALRADPRFDDLLRRMGLDPRPSPSKPR
jgi:TolB-like protein/DNA-binding winged helix-turn-helix (wHTH) protein/Tfp pilus assembly protein PilF